VISVPECCVPVYNLHVTFPLLSFIAVALSRRIVDCKKTVLWRNKCVTVYELLVYDARCNFVLVASELCLVCVICYQDVAAFAVLYIVGNKEKLWWLLKSEHTEYVCLILRWLAVSSYSQSYINIVDTCVRASCGDSCIKRSWVNVLYLWHVLRYFTSSTYFDRLGRFVNITSFEQVVTRVCYSFDAVEQYFYVHSSVWFSCSLSACVACDSTCALQYC